MTVILANNVTTGRQTIRFHRRHRHPTCSASIRAETGPIAVLAAVPQPVTTPALAPLARMSAPSCANVLLKLRFGMISWAAFQRMRAVDPWVAESASRFHARTIKIARMEHHAISDRVMERIKQRTQHLSRSVESALQTMSPAAWQPVAQARSARPSQSIPSACTSLGSIA